MSRREGEGKYHFIEHDVAREYDLFGLEAEAPISTMVLRVPEEGTWCGSLRQFVLRCGDEIRVA